MQFIGLVERATGPFCRATSPTAERPTPHQMVNGLRALDSAASCRRERPSWPFHPDPIESFRLSQCPASTVKPNDSIASEWTNLMPARRNNARTPPPGRTAHTSLALPDRRTIRFALPRFPATIPRQGHAPHNTTPGFENHPTPTSNFKLRTSALLALQHERLGRRNSAAVRALDIRDAADAK
jgi:hypothetical protein